VSDQIITEKVERGAKIVDAVSNDGAPFKWNSLAFTKAVQFVTGLRVYLHDSGMGLSALESLDGLIKVRKILFGPVDLYPNADQVRHEETSTAQIDRARNRA